MDKDVEGTAARGTGLVEISTQCGASGAFNTPAVRSRRLPASRPASAASGVSDKFWIDMCSALSGPIRSACAIAPRIAPPWLTITTSRPACSSASRSIAAPTRVMTSAMLSPPGGFS